MTCLIVERHAWETGAGRQQIQIPRAAFNQFFGAAGDVWADVYASPWLTNPTRRVRAQLSAYQPSGTYRINRVYEIANIGAAFIFIQEEPPEPDLRRYSLWWDLDLALVAARFDGWDKARDSQYGRGRVWNVVTAAVTRPLTW